MNLSFYDHHRQSYASLALRDAVDAEFMVGDYGDGVAEGGEFSIVLIRLGGSGFSDRSYLAPQLRVFADAGGSLAAFLATGVMDEINKTKVYSRDEFSRILLAAGLTDRSDHPIGYEPCCRMCNQPIWAAVNTSDKATTPVAEPSSPTGDGGEACPVRESDASGSTPPLPITSFSDSEGST